MRLKDKVVLVTASTRGIGYAISKACAEEGATVYFAARNKERAQEAIDHLVSLGLKAKFVYNDASKPETFVSMIDEVVAQEGRLDVLVNNFGTSDPRQDKQISDTDVDYFSQTVITNLDSVFIASQRAIEQMRKQGSGSIINISSIGGQVPDISQVAYGTSKAAIIYLTKLIAVQEARHGIRCNTVLPGMTATDAVKDNLNDAFKDVFLKNTPMGRMGEPDEIAAAVTYFASDESAYTTGQVLAISGGFGLATPVYGDFVGASRA